MISPVNRLETLLLVLSKYCIESNFATDIQNRISSPIVETGMNGKDHFQHIVYDNHEQLKAQLDNKIKAVILN